MSYYLTVFYLGQTSSVLHFKMVVGVWKSLLMGGSRGCFIDDKTKDYRIKTEKNNKNI